MANNSSKIANFGKARNSGMSAGFSATPSSDTTVNSTVPSPSMTNGPHTANSPDIFTLQRPPLPHPRMSVAQRAKIFIPFNPLKGFHEALREKEHEIESCAKPTLSEDRKRELDQLIKLLSPSMNVSVDAYISGMVHRFRGPLQNVDLSHEYIEVDEHRIALDSICNIELLD